MKVLMKGNLVFYPMNCNSTFCDKTTKPKYMAGTLYAGIFPDSIHTLEEIMATYPDIKEVELTAKEVVKA